MTTQDYDFLIFIGRFQPLHFGHMAVIREGLKRAKHLIILCGSAHQARNSRNPWSISEREAMIRGALSNDESARLLFAPLMDVVYNDEVWVRNVQSTVNGLVTAHHVVPHKKPNIGLIGHNKDQSSYYLNLFPQWGNVNVDNFSNMSATPLREAFFGVNHDGGSAFLESAVAQQAMPESVRQHLKEFTQKEDFSYIRDEHAFIAKYKSAWVNAPYPPTFVTVDAVVIQSGHILLVRRKASPGAGLLALPGGFVNQNEKLVDACIRELREETRVKVPVPVLKGSIKAQQVFDDPHRSARGRTISHAFHIELTPSSELPKVKGSDDARHAMWLPLADLQPDQLFEDHYFIVQELIGF